MKFALAFAKFDLVVVKFDLAMVKFVFVVVTFDFVVVTFVLPRLQLGPSLGPRLQRSHELSRRRRSVAWLLGQRRVNAVLNVFR